MKFLDFLNFSVTPFHTVEFLSKEFSLAGFELFEEGKSFELECGRSYFVKRGGGLIAFRMPKSLCGMSRFRIALAHTDFPALKISPNPDKSCAGISTLHTEVYGGALFTSWLDRDLGYAGMLAYSKNGLIQTKLIRGEKLFRIPQLAIHLNRGVNQDGLKVNPQTDLDALWCASSGIGFVDCLRRELCEDEKLLDFDVQLFDAQPANIGGFNDEWVYSGRLDNLSSCHAVAQALLNAECADNDVCMACFFNNEEVGSGTREGAAGNFIKSVLEYVWMNGAGNAQNKIPLASCLSASFALSIDMAHAEHPNHPEKHDMNHAPILGKGIVLKSNSQKRYASDLMSSARLRMLCEAAGLNLQVFVARNDMPCGSTVGPVISSNLGIPTVDIGEPMLSMHSVREMMALKDHNDTISLVTEFFK